MTAYLNIIFIVALALALALAVSVGHRLRIRIAQTPTTSGVNITRSFLDRLFLGVMGLLFMLPTGWFLWDYYTNKVRPGTPLTDRLLGGVAAEVILAVFLLSLCSFIWGVAAPRWLEKLFRKAIRNFLLMLALVSLVLLACMTYMFLLGR
jgi:hypothetical protein